MSFIAYLGFLAAVESNPSYGKRRGPNKSILTSFVWVLVFIVLAIPVLAF